MRIKGTVKNGVVAVDLPEGTAVTVIVEEMPVDRCQLDAQADQSEGILARDLIAELRRTR